jgi:hypothetical protein
LGTPVTLVGDPGSGFGARVASDPGDPERLGVSEFYAVSLDERGTLRDLQEGEILGRQQGGYSAHE